MNKLISIIVPIYNIEKYLDRCVQSIINQTYQNLEIILVDDGSTDSSPQICNKYADCDNRVKVIHKTNGGLVSARKAGFQKATGDYIGNVDGDDWIEPEMFEKLVDALEKNNADFSQCGYLAELLDGTKKNGKQENICITFTERERKFCVNGFVGTGEKLLFLPQIWIRLVKKNLMIAAYENVPDCLSTNEDGLCFLYLIFFALKGCAISESYYHYMIRDDSVSNNNSITTIKKYNIMNLHIIDIIKKKFCDIDDKYLDNYYLSYGISLLDNYFSKRLGNTRLPRFSFPDTNVLQDKKIVIYGAGNVGQDYVAQISKYQRISIVAWVDKKYTDYSFEYRDVEPVEHIKNIDFDYILIAISKVSIADEVKNELVCLGVNPENILWQKPNTLSD